MSEALRATIRLDVNRVGKQAPTRASSTETDGSVDEDDDSESNHYGHCEAAGRNPFGEHVFHKMKVTDWSKITEQHVDWLGLHLLRGRNLTHSEVIFRFRGPYPERFFELAATKLSLSRQTRRLDVRCGPGNLAIGFAPFCWQLHGD